MGTRDDYRRDYDDRYRERYETFDDRDRDDDRRRYDGWGGQSGSGSGSMAGRYSGGGRQDLDSVQRGYGGGYGGQRMGYGGERMGYGGERMGYGGERMGYRRDDEPGYGYGGNRQDFERDPRYGARDFSSRDFVSDRDRDRDYGGTLGHVDRPYAMQRGSQWGTGGPFEGPRGGHRGKGPSGYTRSDERIREDVNDALTHDDEIDASSIEVEVKHGEVMLSGQVPERRMKRLAEDCLERIPGIKDVSNHIRVQERNDVGRNMAAERGTNTGAMHAQSVSNAPEKDTDNGKRRGPSA